MGPFFRVCSIVLVACWCLLLVGLVLSLFAGAGRHDPSAGLVAWVLGGLFGLLPTAALFHIAGEVTAIADLLIERKYSGARAPGNGRAM